MNDDPPLADAVDRRLLQLLLRGESNKRISAALGVPVSTVKWRLHRLYARFGVESRSALIVKIRDQSNLHEHDS